MLRISVSLLVLLVTATLAHAQSAPASVYVGAGLGLPHAPDGLAEVRERGPALDFGLDFPFEGEVLQVQFSIRQFGIDEAYYTNSSGAPDIDGGTAVALSALAHFRVDFIKARTTPFVHIGGGGLIMQFSPYTVRRSHRTTKYDGFSDFAPALSAGAGMNIKLAGDVDYYWGLGYTVALTKGGASRYLTPTFGLRFRPKRGR